jgi:hypothetical protein
MPVEEAAALVVWVQMPQVLIIQMQQVALVEMV